MYKYVAKEKVDKYKAYCQSVLRKLIKRLEKEYAIKAHVTLIGSGAEDMVTRNGKGPFDLDYNLVLMSISKKYEDSPGLLRNRVREVMDDLVDGRFSNVFIWNPVPYSKNVDEKIARIKKSGRWDDVERAYLDLKNMYLIPLLNAWMPYSESLGGWRKRCGLSFGRV